MTFLAEQYRLHAQQVFRRCLVMGRGNTAWAEDVTHDVFIRLIEKAPELDQNETLLPWLLTVAYRLCADRLRRERGVWTRIQAALVATSAADAKEERTDDRDLAAKLEGSLEQLPPRERVVVAMKYLDGLRQTAIAEAVGCSEGYVSKLLRRALERLRQLGWELDNA
jgi:RNA polymerase sigma factor (sigma-70 family)